jgi:hypothetical protein
MANGIVGAVDGLWRFPVKSMRGERLEQAEFTERGLVGDRAYALIDADTGKVVSAKSVRLFPGLFGCRAAFVEPPRSGGGLPPVRITLPDGTSVTSDSSDVDRVLSAYFRRDVTLARAAPDDFTIDQYHPDVEDVDPAGYRDTVVEQKLGSAFFAQAGLASPVPVGSFLDLFPVSSVRPDDIHPRAAERASAPKPLRPAAVPDERDRWHQRSWVRRERLDRPRAHVRGRGTARHGPARSAMRDDDARPRGAPQRHRCPPDAHSAQQSPSGRCRSVPLCGRVRRSRSAGNGASR